jgi:hypothetical protein
METESIACTAVIKILGESSNKQYIRFFIKGSDCAPPEVTYKGKTAPEYYWPIHANYSKALGLNKAGQHAIVELYFDWDDDHQRWNTSFGEIQMASLLEARKAIRELSES